MCVYAYIYMHKMLIYSIYICKYIYIYICLYPCIYIYVLYIDACICIYIYTYTPHIHVYVCMYICAKLAIFVDYGKSRPGQLLSSILLKDNFWELGQLFVSMESSRYIILIYIDLLI